MYDKNIFNRCLDKLVHLPPVKGVEQVSKNVRNANTQYDTLLDVETETGVLHFKASVKTMLKRPLPAHLFSVQSETEKPTLVMTEYVNASIAEDLKKVHVNFIDCQGNVYIHIPHRIYVEVDGRKPKKEKEKQTTSMLQPKGLQLLFILLTEPDALNETIRTLANKASISIPTLL